MFDKPFVGDAPDYSDPTLWLALPAQTEHPVDLIYLYPTACMRPFAPLVCAIDDKDMRKTARAYISLQCPAFEGYCNIFVPWYRQVSGTAVFTKSFEEVDAAQWAEPRTCVFAAMDYYFEHLNGGRPWIIAGHSQGSRMLSMVLGEYMREHPEYYERMVVAYRIGDGMTRGYLAEYPHVKAAQGADDLGVCVSWNTEGPGNAGCASLVVPPDCVAINPMNWRTDDAVAGEELCLGCWNATTDGDGELVPLDVKTSAVLDLERGTVVVQNPALSKYSIAQSMPLLLRPLVKRTFGPESHHINDYSFFLGSIRENVELRIDKWFEAHPQA